MTPAFAQSRKDPLTEQQQEAVREAGDQPLERVKLFVGYVEDRAKEIHTVNADPIAQNKTARLHNLLDEFTRLSDDLQDNMDQYDEQHADLRKVLKDIITKTDEWEKSWPSQNPAPNMTLCAKQPLTPTRVRMRRP